MCRSVPYTPTNVGVGETEFVLQLECELKRSIFFKQRYNFCILEMMFWTTALSWKTLRLKWDSSSNYGNYINSSIANLIGREANQRNESIGELSWSPSLSWTPFLDHPPFPDHPFKNEFESITAICFYSVSKVRSCISDDSLDLMGDVPVMSDRFQYLKVGLNSKAPYICRSWTVQNPCIFQLTEVHSCQPRKFSTWTNPDVRSNDGGWRLAI